MLQDIIEGHTAVIKGENMPDAGILESFKSTLKRAQSLGLDISVLGRRKKLSKENTNQCRSQRHSIIEGVRQAPWKISSLQVIVSRK